MHVGQALTIYELYLKRYGFEANSLIAQGNLLISAPQPPNFPEIDINGRAGLGATHSSPLRIHSDNPSVVSAITAQGEGGRLRAQANNPGATLVHSYLIQPVLKNALRSGLSAELRSRVAVQPRNSNDPPATLPPPPPPATPRPLNPRRDMLPDRPVEPGTTPWQPIPCNYRGRGPYTGVMFPPSNVCEPVEAK
jgi:hypothetical protein